MEITKAHGTGNDFVVLADPANEVELSPEAVRALCDRHFGIGADGVIRIGSQDGMAFMDYRNADGSVAEMCGNGTRVVGKYLGDREITSNSLPLLTRAGIKTLTLFREANGAVDEVEVDMGPPEVAPDSVPVTIDGVELVAHPVSMGNPHAVVFVADPDKTPVTQWGTAIEHDSAFPLGTNVEFVSPRPLVQRTWERGVGETLACGTGACAVLVAAVNAGCARRNEPTVIRLRGGDLTLRWTDETVFLRGPAVEVFSADIDPARFGIPLTS